MTWRMEYPVASQKMASELVGLMPYTRSIGRTMKTMSIYELPKAGRITSSGYVIELVLHY